MDSPKILYVRVERRALFPPQFQVSDKLEDFKQSGPVATYRLERVNHLSVERNLSKAAIGEPGAASPAPSNSPAAAKRPTKKGR